MAGGIRGIRALRVQRDAIKEQIAIDDDDDMVRPGTNRGLKPLDRFERYGGKVAGQRAAAAQEERKQ